MRVLRLAWTCLLLVCCAPSAESLTAPPASAPSLGHVLGPEAPWPLVQDALRTLLQRHTERFTLLLPAQEDTFRCEVDGPAATLTCEDVERRFESVEAMVRAVQAGQVHQAVQVRRLMDVGRLQTRGVPLVPDGALQRREDLVEWWLDWLDDHGREEQEEALRVRVQLRVKARGQIEAIVQVGEETEELEAASEMALVSKLREGLFIRSARRSEQLREDRLAHALDPFLSPLSVPGAPLAYGDLVLGTPLRRVSHRLQEAAVYEPKAGARRDQVRRFQCLDCARPLAIDILDGKVALVSHQGVIALGRNDVPSFQRRCEELGDHLARQPGMAVESDRVSECEWIVRRAQGHIELSLRGEELNVTVQSDASVEAKRRRDRALRCEYCRLRPVGFLMNEEGIVRAVNHKDCTLTLEQSFPGISRELEGRLIVVACNWIM